MKISFVVPVYKKEEDSFRKTLKSLTDQSYKDIEVICVFDGPDPKLEPIPLDFQTVKTKVIEHGGACKARNAGLDMATGEVVCFWDADCVIEPDACQIWMDILIKNKDVDFVYSGYKFKDPRYPGHVPEHFDKYTLSKYNYIPSMSPIRKDKAPRWDETLEGLQDWDYFRTAVENGCIGHYEPGYMFATDFPKEGDISHKSPEKVKEHIEIVRKKHGDIDCPFLVQGRLDWAETVKIAKLLDADTFSNSGYWRVRDYRGVVHIGMYPNEQDNVGYLLGEVDENIPKVLYWLGKDAETILSGYPFNVVKFMIDTIKARNIKNICGDLPTKKVLSDLGIESEIVHLPRYEGDVLTTLPDKFRVQAIVDESNHELIDSVIKALPDIKFDVFTPGEYYDNKLYSCGIQFSNSKRLFPPTKNLLLHGRWIASNVQEPFCGYIEMEDITKFKEELIGKIREFEKKTEINKEAQDYYLELYDRDKFKSKMLDLLATKLEVVG